MDSNESPRAHKRRATVGLFCCCPLPSDTLELDSRVVRITAGVIAIIAMLLSGIGFSALQRDTVNPYEHLFVSASSSRHLTPAAWGSASAPAPFLQPILQPSGGFVSAEGTGQGSPEEASLDHTGGPTEAPAGGVIGADMAESSMQSPDSTGQSTTSHAEGPQQNPGSEASQGTASVESVASDSDSLATPGGSPAWSGVPSSITGMAKAPTAAVGSEATSPSPLLPTSGPALPLVSGAAGNTAAAPQPAYSTDIAAGSALSPAVYIGSASNPTDSSGAAGNQTLDRGSATTDAAGNSTTGVAAPSAGPNSIASMGVENAGSGNLAGLNSTAGSAAPGAGSNTTASMGAADTGTNSTAGSSIQAPLGSPNSTAAARPSLSPAADESPALPSPSIVAFPVAQSALPPSPLPIDTRHSPGVRNASPASPDTAYLSPTPLSPSANDTLPSAAAAAGLLPATNSSSPAVVSTAASSSPDATANSTVGIPFSSAGLPLSGSGNSSMGPNPGESSPLPTAGEPLSGSGNSSVGGTGAPMVGSQGSNSTTRSENSRSDNSGSGVSGNGSGMSPGSTTRLSHPGQQTALVGLAPSPSAALAGPDQGSLRGGSLSGTAGSGRDDAASDNTGVSGDIGARSSLPGSTGISGSNAGMGSGSSGGDGGSVGGDGGALGSSFAAGPGAMLAGTSLQQAIAPRGQRLSAAAGLVSEGSPSGLPGTALTPGYPVRSSNDSSDTLGPSSSTAPPTAGRLGPGSGLVDPSSGTADAGRGEAGFSGGLALPPGTAAGAGLQGTAGSGPWLPGSPQYIAQAPAASGVRDGSRAGGAGAPAQGPLQATSPGTPPTASGPDAASTAQITTGPEGSRDSFPRALAPAGAASAPGSAVADGGGHEPHAPLMTTGGPAGLSLAAAASALGPATAGSQSSSSGSIGRRDGSASIERASTEEDSPVMGGNTAAPGKLGPGLAPGPATSSSEGFLSRSGNNASASIEGLPDAGSDSTPAPAVAPIPPPASSEVAGGDSSLSMSWWLWLLVAIATVATWLCCCCCMAAVLLLHRRSKRRIMAEPADIEDATAAMATAATAVVAPTLLKQPATMQNKTSALPALTSGPNLSQAVQEATAAADAEIVAVPESQQHETTLPGPGINVAFLSSHHASSPAALHASEMPVDAQEGRGALQQEGSTASVMALTAVAASATVVVQQWGDRQQPAAGAQAGSTHSADSSQLTSFTSQQSAADGGTDSTGNAESSQSSSDNSQQVQAQVSDRGGEQQAEAASDAGPWSISAQGHQAENSREGGEDESSVKTPGSSVSMGPSVKQSVRRLEQLHAAMRDKS